MAQARHGRRGSVFGIRVTDDERAAIEAAHANDNGPRALGPWLVHRALGGAPPAAVAVLPGRGALERVLPAPAAVVPARASPPVGERLILDLCAGSGSWSKPYETAGYDVVRVTLPDTDVRTFVAPERPVWGVLAGPPCDQFSLARNGQKTPRDLVRGLETVSACMRVVLTTKPRWWALENPVGLLSTFLGTPRDVWQPCDFGDPWTKRTAIWGDYAIPARGPYVAPRGGGPFCDVCDPSRRKTTWCSRADHRAVTPHGFARAFFDANP